MSEPQGQGSLAQFWNRYRPSQAAGVSAAVGAALLVLFFANWAAYRSQPQRVAWSDYMQWPQYVAALVLWLIICALVYWLVQMWHEELPTDDVTIESAWQAGMKSLRTRGKTLQQAPLFVILGAQGRQHQQQLLAQSGLHLLDAIVPAEPDAPIHWAFTDQGVWLFVQNAGTYSRIAQSPAMISAMDAWSSWTVQEVPTQRHTEESLEIDHGPEPTRTGYRATHPGPSSYGSEFGLQPAGNNSLLLQEPGAAPGGNDGGANGHSTDERLDDLEELIEQASQAESVVAKPEIDPNSLDYASQRAWQTELAFQSAAQPTGLSSTEIAHCQHALREVCRRLRSERGSLAPANGVVTITSCPQLMAGCVRASELGLALRSDLQIFQDAWQLQTPTSIMIDGLEYLAGASELVRRGGPERAKSDGIGAAYPIRHQPEKPLLDHHCQMAVGQIESRIYRQLSAEDSLSQVGNHQLFQLLIACRGRLLPALQTLVGEAVALGYQSEGQREPILFAGLHFMASGQKVTEQAWVKAAFAHVLNAQNFLRWTTERLQSDRRHKLSISILKAVCLLLIVGLLVAFWLAG